VVAYGRFITAVVHVLIIGTVLFFIVRAADRLFTREKKPTEVEVLAEIRDELRARRTTPNIRSLGRPPR
jgi:large conductance mechanosensitive channel